MDDSLNGLYRLEKDDTKRAGEVLGWAFYTDPLMLHAYPDGTPSVEDLSWFFITALKYCLKYGEAYAPTAEIEGAALWLPSDKCPITFWRMLRVASLWSMFKAMRRIGFGRMKRMATIGGFLDKAQKRLVPFEHCYLQTLGVDPAHQGNGYASKLLRPMFDRLDEEGMPCYLDTLTERNAQIYEHLGFKVLEETGIPDTDILAWAMLREPL
jgi:ribosomal protein S18 acetylase RimI-like enzyme